MGRRESASRGADGALVGRTDKILIGAAALALGWLIVPQASSASVLDVTGGNGLDSGALCDLGQLCPSTPVFNWSSGGAVTGSFNYTPGTVAFTLTTTAPTYFGGEELLAGATFSGSVPVGVTTSGGFETLAQSLTPSANGSTTGVVFSPGLSVTQNTPLLTALRCQILISNGNGTCTVSVGSPNGASPNMLELTDPSNNNYSAIFAFSTNVSTVPVPAAAWLMLSGLGGVGALLRRRRGLTVTAA